MGGAHEIFHGSNKDMVGVLWASKLTFKNLCLFKILDRFYIQVIIRATFTKLCCSITFYHYNILLTYHLIKCHSSTYHAFRLEHFDVYLWDLRWQLLDLGFQERWEALGFIMRWTQSSWFCGWCTWSVWFWVF